MPVTIRMTVHLDREFIEAAIREKLARDEKLRPTKGSPVDLTFNPSGGVFGATVPCEKIPIVPDWSGDK